MNTKDRVENRVELLSPAGNYECFESAIKAGADAVYLAGDKFGARAYAGNFSCEDLLRALDYAHIFGRKIFMTVNTVLKEDEISLLTDYIRPYYEAGLDAVIVQDIGVMHILKECFPDMEMHVSTQTSITDSAGVNLLKEYGADRIVLGRELSLSEIRDIKDKTGMPLECFIHGAMCYCYSGKCLFSSLLGGRSGNRGRCAQPCRLPYNGKYPLSMKDMYTLRIIPSLIEAGIDSFKIEGRMKSPDYVATVTGIYRKYIDMFYDSGNKYAVDKKDEKLILDLYTRSGNCEGYYSQYNGRDMVTIDFPGYNGAKSYNEYASVYLQAEMPHIAVKGKARLCIGDKAQLSLDTGEISVTVQSDVIEPAQKAPTSPEVVMRQLNKTGGDCFIFDSIDIESDDNIFIPVSKLNGLRRDAFDALKFAILSKYKRTYELDDNKDAGRRSGVVGTSSKKAAERVTQADNVAIIAAEGFCRETVLAIAASKCADRIIVPVSLLYGKGNNAITDDVFADELVKLTGDYTDIYIKLPMVIRNITEKKMDLIKAILSMDFVKGVYADNYEALGLLKQIGFDKDIVADIHLYCLGTAAVASLGELGVDLTTVPIELNKNELRTRSVYGEEMIVYGRIPLMVSAQCVRKTLDKCTSTPGFFYINDRKNISFPVFCNCNECLNIIFNSVPNFVKRENEIFDIVKPSVKRLIFTNEDGKMIRSMLEYYRSNGNAPQFEYTLGHITRGIE